MAPYNVRTDTPIRLPIVYDSAGTQFLPRCGKIEHGPYVKRFTRERIAHGATVSPVGDSHTVPVHAYPPIQLGTFPLKCDRLGTHDNGSTVACANIM